MAKKILKIDFSSSIDFTLAGIICGFRNYRLCFELNRTFSLNLERIDDICLPAGLPGSETRHACYCHKDSDGRWLHLVSNKDRDGTGFFVPEMRNIDYFLLVTENADDYLMDNFIPKLRDVNIISGAYEIDPVQLKSASAFIYVLER